MRTLNLGILAHVDAGKTSLTERLLHAAGVIDEIGSVDDGSTQTDSLALERRRGITIKSAVVSFVVGDVVVNLIDTPGHPDFIAEVERVLNVLDGAVLVISAVEGVQSQTRVLMRTLQRLGIPTLVFVNKIDRRGARDGAVLRDISAKLTPAIVPMGSVRTPGTRAAAYVPGVMAEAVDVLADHDDELLAAYLEDEISHLRLHGELAVQTKAGLVHPIFFGSAITGAGVDELIAGVRDLLPAAEGDANGPVSGTVFKVERGAAGERIAYVRLRSGTLHTRDRLPQGKLTAIRVFDRGAAVSSDRVAAGRIAQLWGLNDVRIGDAIGEGIADDAHHFAPPTLETVVEPVRPEDRGALHGALTQLAEQDPLIDLRFGEEIHVSLYGEVQKEVIQATLATGFGVDVRFRETTTLCIERPAGSGEAVEVGEQQGNPFLATVGLRVDPAPAGSGVAFRLEVELGSMPSAFFRAVEETVAQTLGQGLYGWQVTDCLVTMTHSGYWPRQSHSHATFDKSMSSTAGDFRGLTPLVLMRALARAGTTVHEPLHRFRLELPADTLGAVLPALARLRAVPQLTGASGVLEGTIPAAQVHRLQQELPGLTRGEGVLESGFSHHTPVQGPFPLRARTRPDALDREDYLMRVTR
ncbi:elongation factor G [Candidatus Solirubrobacter pratensis]|uniref:elongation factor G n=1 Tax=Candidatus Solirubrobacter pratensis TaxID=1298857 RepID=UPI00041093D0|nr:TetM/TetW/TetO/TetS family tetracycline resistance ribosomal protection protein [Candidatus Solirubrobacter pratensis]